MKQKIIYLTGGVITALIAFVISMIIDFNLSFSLRLIIASSSGIGTMVGLYLYISKKDINR
jgi:hypothetical protein